MEITKIRGISEQREKEFNSLGIFNTEDMLNFFPRSYLDLSVRQSLQYAYHGDMVLTNATLISLPTQRLYSRLKIVRVYAEQEGLNFSIVWFNQPYVASKLKVGVEYLFYGRVVRKDGVLELVNPSFEPCEKVYRLKGIVPQYSTKNKLSQKLVRDSVKLAVNLEKPKSIIPYNLQEKYALTDLYTAYKEVHNPSDFKSLKMASERIAIEEYFGLISAFKLLKGDGKSIRTNKYNCSFEEVESFIQNTFNFAFTNGQSCAVKDVFSDMTGLNVMNRLIQGDVGSGKTAVSTCALFVAIKSGYQAVVLSPTEVLANQNYNVIKKAFPNVEIDFIAGSTPQKQKKIIKERVFMGITKILVGTHAVLQEDVNFNNLALCICDEQQRFGVAQRSALLNKGVMPDLLVMSATPIPRTLALILYGDLDITTITDKPKNRQPVQTNYVREEKYLDMLKFITEQVKNGRQAYFVCPKIDGDEEGTLMGATELYQDLSDKLIGVKVGLMHGKMKDKEKTAVMESFKNKEIDVLVSTTVIEVGVDVANATVMVIYNAERFGLSQLHQLRGRVGRSDIKSYCFLTSTSKSPEAMERLKILIENDDGFKISEHDYKMRGSGDFMGVKQSGKFMTELGNLDYSTDSIFLAKKISDEVFAQGKVGENIILLAEKRYNKLKDVTLN
ncbi:MAG: ATP-dependent DNA helicase RecG [Clostridia bacterium]|nr:ATP-dependent DNA helicase RecG [Clostridia bacterium]